MIIRNCNYCNIEFKANTREINRGHGKYCSRRCSGLMKSSLPKRITHTKLTCSLCDKEFTRLRLSKSKSGFRFCSRECKDKAQKISSGSFEAMRPKHFGTDSGKRTYRTKAFKYLPHKCNRCGYCEVPGILKVHHKDRNRANSDIENLEILCPNCHDLDHYLNKDGVYSSNNGSVLPNVELRALL